MTFINLEPSISPRLQELIQEANPSIHTAKEKILTAYNYAIENDGLRPKEAAKILKKKLDFPASYIRKVLSLKAKDQSKVRPKQFSTKFAPTEVQNLAENDKNVVNIASAYDIQDDVETTSREYMVKDSGGSNTTTAVGAEAETEIEDQSEQQQFITIQEKYIKQLEELEITRQVLDSKRQQNRSVLSEIR